MTSVIVFPCLSVAALLTIAVASSAAVSSQATQEAVVVTVHKLTPGTQELLTQLAKDTAECGRHLYALVDMAKVLDENMLTNFGTLVGGMDNLIMMTYEDAQRDVFPDDTPAQQQLFKVFQGMHHSPAKPGALWWLAEGPGSKYEFAWIIESDVRFGGDWCKLFDAYTSQVDLVSMVDTPGPEWPNWKDCTHKGCQSLGRHRSFLPAFRVSKRLAEDVLQTLRSGITGHHEALLDAVCAEEKNWTCVANDLRTAGLIGAMCDKADRPSCYSTLFMHYEPLQNGKLYHPVKTLFLSRIERSIDITRH